MGFLQAQHLEAILEEQPECWWGGGGDAEGPEDW